MTPAKKTPDFIENLVSAFNARTLPKTDWTHEAHIIVAFSYCSRFHETDAFQKLKKAIQDYNTSVGTENTETSGYHETLTLFWLTLVRQYLIFGNPKDLTTGINDFIHSGFADKTIPLNFYSHELLFSKEARHHWVAPDKLPLQDLKKLLNKNIEPHFDLSDDEFEKQFETCQLNPALFTHEAHLRLAWIHIRKYGRDTAIQNITTQLLTFVEFLGATQKFNKTLTVAAVFAVDHFMNKTDRQHFYPFIQEFPRLKYNFRELIATHYKIDIFNSEQAKKEFVRPDLAPFY